MPKEVWEVDQAEGSKMGRKEVPQRDLPALLTELEEKGATKIRRSPNPPLPVRVAPLLLLITAVYSLVLLFWVLSEPSPAVSLEGRSISTSQFKLIIAPLVALGSVSSIVVGWGVRKERKWARRVAFRMAVLISVLTLLGLVSLGQSLPGLLLAQGWKLALGLICLHIVLYGRGSVKDYFDRLESAKSGSCGRRRSSSASPSD